MAFLTACLDEDERRAWQALARQSLAGRLVSRRVVEVPFGAALPEWTRSAWPPKRVLAEVAERRQLLIQHEAQDWGEGHVICATCHEEDGAGIRWPCPTVRNLAAAYAARPGWRKWWGLRYY